MNRDQVIATLRRHRGELERRGVKHAALFGSTARDDQRPDSDVDIMVDIDPNSTMSVYDFVGLQSFISTLFDEHVDIVEREGLKTSIRASTLRDAIYAF